VSELRFEQGPTHLTKIFCGLDIVRLILKEWKLWWCCTCG